MARRDAPFGPETRHSSRNGENSLVDGTAGLLSRTDPRQPNLLDGCDPDLRPPGKSDFLDAYVTRGGGPDLQLA